MGKLSKSNWLIEQVLEIQEQERRRISMDLHDSLAQELSMIKIYLGSLSDSEKGSAAYSKAITEMQSLIEGAVCSVREISHDLSPSLIEKNSLSKAMEMLISRCETNKNHQFKFRCDAEISLSSKQEELYIYRTVQEFIQNSVKHSEASIITAEATVKNGIVEITVSDNGVGFDITGDYNSIGLGNIDTRMRVIGAKYEYCSVPGIGTDLKIYINEKGH